MQDIITTKIEAAWRKEQQRKSTTADKRSVLSCLAKAFVVEKEVYFE